MLDRHPAFRRRRSTFLRLERLEERTTPAVYYSPSQIRAAYGVNQLAQVNGTTLDGTGETIAIVDAYGDSNIKNDLATFDSDFGIPAPPNFTVVSQTGSTTNLPQFNGSWATETSLDVEYAHAIAPKANILLVEATNQNSPSGTILNDLAIAVAYAANQPGVVAVSMSWGYPEFSGETSTTQNNTFTTPSGHIGASGQPGGVAFLAAAGDTGAETIWPSVSSNVLSVGGTSLTVNSTNGSYVSESAWSDGGGGPSTFFTKPSYQTAYTGTHRATPDVSLDADPNTGVEVQSTSDGGLIVVGGTSASTPIWAGLVALADQGRALESEGSLDGVSQLLPAIYSIYATSPTDFNDVTSGSNGYPAMVGYDLATGIGSPKAQLVIPALIAYGAPGSPVIGTEPTGQTAVAGQTATFTASATGTPAPTVQWQLSTDNGNTWSNISGATSASYTTPATVAGNNGYEYRAVFSNGVGSPATTTAATLTVDFAPTVTTQPANQSVSPGQTATFTAAASGNPTPSVQWQLSTNGGVTFNNINGATSVSYTTPAATSANNGYQYQAVFTNGIGAPATTSVATLSVAAAPTVSQEPTGQSVTVGQMATFTAAANGNPTPTVQWQESINGGPFANITGATSATYSFTPALTDNGDHFRAVFSNTGGSVNTFGVPLTVVAPVTVGPIQVGDGTAQRSEVRSITVTFSGAVTFAGGNVAGAFELTNIQDSADVILTATTSTNGSGQTVVVLTFSGTETDATSANNPQALSPAPLLSLADGRYTLTITSASVTDANGAALDGLGTGTAGSGNYISPPDTQGGGAGQLGMFRLFGDTNGDGVVDQTDLGQFRSAFNTSAGDPNYLAYLDADNSGTIDQTDLGQFRTRFNESIF